MKRNFESSLTLNGQRPLEISLLSQVLFFIMARLSLSKIEPFLISLISCHATNKIRSRGKIHERKTIDQSKGQVYLVMHCEYVFLFSWRKEKQYV